MWDIQQTSALAAQGKGIWGWGQAEGGGGQGQYDGDDEDDYNGKGGNNKSKCMVTYENVHSDFSSFQHLDPHLICLTLHLVSDIPLYFCTLAMQMISVLE